MGISAIPSKCRTYPRSLLYLTLFSAIMTSSVNCENFTIGYLANFIGRSNQVRQGVIISGAITYALDVINRDETLLKGHYLKMIHNDTNGERLIGTKAVVEQYTKGVMAFFGPEDSCDYEATVAASLNLPMISFKCADSKVSNKELYPTFLRTFPTEDRVVRSVIALLQYYQWYKFSVISEKTPQYQTVAYHLLNELKHNRNFTINHKRTFDPHYVCCEEHLPCCEGMYSLIDETYKGTRVYVFIGNTQDLVKMLVTMKISKLLQSGDYVVIYVDLETYSVSESYRYFWPRTAGTGGNTSPKHTAEDMEENFELASSLLVIVPSPPNGQNYREFEDKVREYNQKEPFSMNDTFSPYHKFKKHVTIYASYLYDAVILYATALNKTLENGLDPRNGTAIIQEIIQRQRYKSVTGAEMNIDENGDAEGNYTVLALLPLDSHVVLKGITGNLSKSMVPVGNFHYDHVTKYPIFKLEKTVQWPKVYPPRDEPPCAFNGSACYVAPDQNSEIAASVLASLLVVVSLVAAITYRNWKYEQEIAGLLWKIDIRDVKRGVPDGILGYLSKMSLGSRCTLESKGPAQAIFATTAMYKGTWVAVKHLQFNRKSADIPRQTKKEMKLMREIHQDNVNPFIGACVEPNGIYLVNEYCGKGCLQFILENDNFKLDNMFIASLVFDLIKGMIFLHDSDLKIHGNLKSSNCLITSRWVLQVADFGLHEIRMNAEPVKSDEEYYYRGCLWRAPELLRGHPTNHPGTQKADVYAFGIILHEIMARQGPWGSPDLLAKEIVDRVTNLKEGEDPFRPCLAGIECQDFIKQCIKDCWHEKPDVRPDFRHVRERLNKMREGMKANIMDNMIAMLEKYSHNLEEVVDERTAQLEEEKKKTEALLHRMLPKSVAEELMKGEYVKPESFDAVTIYFSDIVGFTEMSATSTPMEVVTFLNDLYTVFDAIIRNYEVYKVETIGDAYMVVGGLPSRNGDLHASEIASMALELLESIKTFHIRHKPDQTLKLRIGMHTGPVVAGVVGLTMPRYCLFGDTVNTASRMESNGEALKIHVSPQCRDLLEKLGGYSLEERGVIKLKGKGEMKTYWLTGKTSGAPPKRRQTDTVIPQQPLFQPLIKDSDNRSRRSPKLSIAEYPRRGSLALRHDLIQHLEDSNGNINSNVQGAPSFLRVLHDSPQINRVSSGQSGRDRVQRLRDSDFKDKNSASCGDIPNPNLNGGGHSNRALYEIKERPLSPPIVQTPNGKIDGLDDESELNSENEINSDSDYGLRFRSDLHRRSKNGFMMTVNQFQPPIITNESSKPLLPNSDFIPGGISGNGKLCLDGAIMNGNSHLKAPLLPLDSKRWRSCDEINSPKANNKSLRYLFTGILNKKFLDLNRRGSDASVGSARVRSSFVDKNNGESVV